MGCFGGSSHTTVESKYDDQWIKDTFKDYEQSYKEYLKHQDKQDTQIGSKAGTDWTKQQLDTKAGTNWTKDKLKNLGADLTKTFNQQFADLNVGDIGGMQDYIDQIGDLSEFQGDTEQTLSDIQSTAASDKDYLSSLFDNLNTSLYGEGGEGGGTLDQIKTDLGDEISALDTDFTSRLSASDKAGAQNLADVKAALQTDYGGQITDLSSEFGTKLDTTAASLTDTFGKKYDTLSDQLAGAESDLASHKSDTASQFSNVADQYSGLSSDLTDLGTDTSERFDQAYDDARTMYDVIDDDISDLDIKFGTELGAAKDHMASQLKATDEALNKRLTDISTSMNYRMLGNTASGVKIRRSKAFKGGNTFKGTGQLGRQMKIGTLNL